MSDRRNTEERISKDVQRNAQQGVTSNANNFRGAIASQVNPRTGKLQLSIHAPVLPGIGGLHVDLGLEYMQSEGVPPKSVLGLPSMWRYRLSYIADNQIVINGKQSFTVDPVWPSGMRYQSLQNMWLETHNDQPTLPYDSNLRYLNVLCFLSGERQYFDLFGRLIAVADAAKNHILFYYSVDNVPVYQTTLRQIVDTYGQTISFDDSDGNIQVSFPAGGTRQLQFTYQINRALQLTGYQDPDGRTTTIAYGGGLAQTNLVSSVTSPNQLVTEVSYTVIQCDTPAGHRQLDVVSELTRTHQGASRTTRYSFSPGGSPYNYTGYPEYQTLSSEDQLLMSGNNRYRYITTVDNGVTLTKHTYNNLHLELQRDVYASAAPSDLISRTVYAYPGELVQDQAFPSFNKLPATYQMPCEVVTYHYNPGDTSTCRATKIAKDYNDAGQVTSTTRYTSADGQTFSTVQATSTTYDDRFGQMVTQDVSDYRASGVLSGTPAVTRLARTLTSDGSLPASSQIGAVTSGRFSPSRTTSYQYDGQGRILHQTFAWADGGSHQTQSTYHDMTYTYDSRHHQLTIQRTDALGDAAHRIVDTTTGFVLSETDARGHTTQYTYDGLGRKTNQVDALGVPTTWTYDDTHNTITVHHASGYEAYLMYDGFGKLLSHLDTAGPHGARRTLYERAYDELGRLKTETGILGAPTTLTYGYDTRGQIEQITDASGNEKSFTHDAVAQTQTESYNGVATEIRTFDEGRVVKREMLSSDSESSIVTSTGYDSHGRTVLTQVGPDSSSAGLVRSLTYDALSQPVQVDTRGGDGASLTRTDERDLFGSIIRTTKTLDAGHGSSTATSSTHTFDAVGRLQTSQTPTGGTESYTHDGNGNLSTRTDLAGNSFQYAYDACNAILSKSFTDAGVHKSLVYGYDSESHRLTSIESRAGSEIQSEIRYTYALDGKMTQVSYGPGGPSLSWSYDAATGQLLTFTDATGATTRYSYLDDGRLSTIAGASGTATMSYYTKSEDAAHSGRLKSVSFAGGEVSYAYDGFGRISVMTATAGSETVARVAYTYDPVTGNLVEKVSSSTLSPHDPNLNYSVDYQYNGLGQLTQERMKAGGETLVTRTFVYDAAGNVIESAASGSAVQAGTTSFSYDQDNRLTRVSAPGGASRSLRYDDNGNLVNDGAGRTLTWNALGQMTGFSGPGARFAYTYYPDGLRASKQAVGQSPVQFYYDHQKNANIVNEIQGSTAVTHQLAGARRLTRSVDDDVTALFHDRESVVASLTGHSLVSRRFGAEGELDFPSGDSAGAFRIQDNPFAFAGEYRDAESGYYYLRARYYDPELKRFVSRDSVGVFNRYSYCATNPVMLFDPSGHAPWWSYLTMGLAAVTGLAVSLASGGALSWLAGGILEGASLAMTTAVNAGIDATAAAGGAIAGDAVTAVSHSITEHHWAASQFFNENLGIDIATSAAGAALGDVVKFPAIELGDSLIGESKRMAAVARVLAGAVGGAVGGAFAATTNELAKTHHVDWTKVGEHVGISAAGGAVAQFYKEVKPFVQEVKAAVLRQIKMRRQGSYQLEESPDPDEGMIVPPTPKEGAEPELISYRHAEFDEDIDAPVANAAGAGAHNPAGSAGGGNPTSSSGFLLRRRRLWPRSGGYSVAE